MTCYTINSWCVDQISCTYNFKEICICNKITQFVRVTQIYIFLSSLCTVLVSSTTNFLEKTYNNLSRTDYLQEDKVTSLIVYVLIIWKRKLRSQRCSILSSSTVNQYLAITIPLYNWFLTQLHLLLSSGTTDISW